MRLPGSSPKGFKFQKQYQIKEAAPWAAEPRKLDNLRIYVLELNAPLKFLMSIKSWANTTAWGYY